MAAPTFIAKATASTTTAASINQSYMGSIQPGDLLICALISYQQPGGGIGDITADDPGWFFLGGGVGFRDSLLVNAGSFMVFGKFADGTESGSASFSRTGSNGGSNIFYSQMYQFRGTNVVVFDTATNILGDGDSTIQWNSVAVVGLESTAIAIVGQMNGDPGTPAGYTTVATDSSGGVVAYLECSVEENSGGGSASASGGDAEGWATVHIAIFNSAGFVFIPDH